MSNPFPLSNADRRRQIIIDQGREDAPEKGKGVEMAIKEGLLPFTGIASDEVFAGISGPQAKKLDGRLHPADNGHGHPQSTSASRPHSGSNGIKAGDACTPRRTLACRT